MLDRVNSTTETLSGLNSGKIYRYIVQPISYVAIADNVEPESSVAILCK